MRQGAYLSAVTALGQRPECNRTGGGEIEIFPEGDSLLEVLQMR